MEGKHPALINRIYPSNCVSVCVWYMYLTSAKCKCNLTCRLSTCATHLRFSMHNTEWISGNYVYIILFLTSWLYYLRLFSADSGSRVCLLVWLRGQVTAEHCPDSLDRFLLQACWVFRESEGGWGSCDCQGLHNCEWRNVLALGTQKYFSCKYREGWGGIGKRHKMKGKTNQRVNIKCWAFIPYSVCSCVVILEYPCRVGKAQQCEKKRKGLETQKH